VFAALLGQCYTSSMSTCRRVFLGLFGMAACTTAPQTEDVIDSRPQCSSCRVEPVKVLSLPDSLEIQSGMLSASQDSRGRFFVGPTRNQNILVLDSSGTVLRRFGRQGKGPGEFSMIRRFAIVNDTVYVSDLGQVSLLTPDGDFIRRFPLPVLDNTSTFLPLRSDLIAYVGDMWDLKTKTSVYGIHLFDGAGKHVRSLGDSSPRDPKSSPKPVMISTHGLDTIWVAYEHRYEVEKRASSGTVVQRLRRNVEWFPSVGEDAYRRTGAEGMVAQMPLIAGIWEDSSGRLWILTAVANPDWKHPPLPKDPKNQAAYSEFVRSVDWSSMYHYTVEVLDPRRKQLIAASRFPFPGTVYTPNRNGLVVKEAESPSGQRLFEVWGFRLVH
jgi:hypothetical protein